LRDADAGPPGGGVPAHAERAAALGLPERRAAGAGGASRDLRSLDQGPRRGGRLPGRRLLRRGPGAHPRGRGGAGPEAVIVRVGTANPMKVAATRKAFATFFKGAKVVGVDVPSTVSSQPISFGEI